MWSVKVIAWGTAISVVFVIWAVGMYLFGYQVAIRDDAGRQFAAAELEHQAADHLEAAQEFWKTAQAMAADAQTTRNEASTALTQLARETVALGSCVDECGKGRHARGRTVSMTEPVGEEPRTLCTPGMLDCVTLSTSPALTTAH